MQRYKRAVLGFMLLIVMVLLTTSTNLHPTLAHGTQPCPFGSQPRITCAGFTDAGRDTGSITFTYRSSSATVFFFNGNFTRSTFRGSFNELWTGFEATFSAFDRDKVCEAACKKCIDNSDPTVCKVCEKCVEKQVSGLMSSP